MVEQAVESLRRSRELLAPDTIDVPLDYEESFTVADHRFETIHTPGHQAEHVCFQLSTDDTEFLFGGDVLIRPFRAGAINVGLDIGAYDAITAYYSAYDRLSGRNVARVFPGHGPVFADYAATISQSRDDLDDLLCDVEETLRPLPSPSPLRISRERAGGKRLVHVILDTVGALGCLDARGRVTYDDEDGVRRYRCLDTEER